MEVDIIFKADISDNVFKKLSNGWYLAPTDQDTYKYVLKNIYNSAQQGLDGIILKIRNYKYSDIKQLWASINIDKIIYELNPGGDNVTNWISDSLEIIGADSLSIIDAVKDMGVWIDEEDMSIVIDAWRDRKVKSDEDYNTINKIINICIHDNNIISLADAMEIIRQFNKMSNSVMSDFIAANSIRIIEIANEVFECNLEIMIDTQNIESDNVYTIPKEAKNIIWKLLVRNRGLIECLSFNIDTNSNDVEVSKIITYEDSNKRLKLSDIIICECDIQNATLENCVVYKSRFENCTFSKCKTLGVRVRLKNCENYKDELEGQYTIIKDDDTDNEKDQ